MTTPDKLAQTTNETPPHQLQAMGPGRLIVRVRSISYQGDDLNEYELVDPDGRNLPPFTAGSHVDLYFRDGRVRQYSLCNPEAERRCYRIVVQREQQGRGGSKAIFEKVHVGRLLVISLPRNNFCLAKGARRHVLVAGGIGITPLMSMAYALEAASQDFVLHYCTRSPQRTALLQELQPLLRKGKAFIHHDGGDPSKGLDLDGLLSHYDAGSHLYFCGPSGFMRAVEAAAASWPAEALHSESFTPLAPPAAGASMSPADFDGSISVGFQVKIASTGELLAVPNDKSILQVLREHGFSTPSSCEAGVCGTCRTRYLEGEPDHRDYILEDDERETQLLVCCSRSKTPVLVLDV